MSVNSKMTAIANAIRTKTGGTETLTLDEMATEIEGMSAGGEIVTFCQTNDAVSDYINSVTYDAADYSTSQIAAYAGLSTSYDKQRPKGASVTFASAGSLLLADSYTGLAMLEDVNAGANTIYNVVPSEEGGGFILVDDEGAKQCGRIIPTGQVRMIQCETANVRDLGGWACDGGTVKYGKLFRGGEFNANDLDLFTKRLGIKHELNLRGATESAAAPTVLRDYVDYTCPEEYVWYTIGDQYKETWKEILRCVFDAVKSNDPVFFHCSAGADRTGTVACILEAILGMSQSDIDKDYELTCFASGVATDSAARRRDEGEWKGLINQITAKTGSTFRDKVINWVATLGFTSEEINDFRAAMTDGNPEPVTLDLDVYTVTKSLENVTVDNEATSVTQYQPYAANVEPEEGYIISNVSVKMGGVDVTSSVFSGNKTYHTSAVELNLTGCTASNTSNTTASGQAYVSFISAQEEFTLEGASVSIIMGGVDVSTYYENGRIAIPNVTGNLVITIEAVSTANETVPVTWKPGYNCSYTVGSACTASANASYIISDELPVEYGKTYVLNLNCPVNGTGFRFIGISADGKVTEAANITNMTTGAHTYEWTPTLTTTTKMRIRGYSDVSSMFTAVTELKVE